MYHSGMRLAEIITAIVLVAGGMVWQGSHPGAVCTVIGIMVAADRWLGP